VSTATVYELMRYTDASRLTTVYPTPFKTANDAAPYVNNPEALANTVYAHRIGNGDSASGHGWKYRGHGLIQLTGRDNYAALAKDINVDVVQNPEVRRDAEIRGSRRFKGGFSGPKLTPSG
jgi:putative chitinase